MTRAICPDSDLKNAVGRTMLQTIPEVLSFSSKASLAC